MCGLGMAYPVAWLWTDGTLVGVCIGPYQHGLAFHIVCALMAFALISVYDYVLYSRLDTLPCYSIRPIIYSFAQRAQPTSYLEWHLKVLCLFELSGVQGGPSIFAEQLLAVILGPVMLWPVYDTVETFGHFLSRSFREDDLFEFLQSVERHNKWSPGGCIKYGAWAILVTTLIRLPTLV
ncbi:hypothetical protein ACRE_018520 [Hapsidospora chrysogenum ATCC 11550]|uniref:Uncharacterized protein n=1 Tax=Hapsidospora chrysogenum (strain ATCC 11550 / CBS 779.69 / DSM 880 / IAM 14645 / JCM 23072 / IMI 49137) TaxID=857340 RepID=A0A086TCZ8_HAPC1|nr:hypothetical protein ACRE_018520 [Hapsidospora chrysogenum ATCC 11550]